MIIKRDILNKKIERVNKNQNGEYHGIGTLKWHSGTILKAEWDNGVLIRMIQITTPQANWVFQGNQINGYTGTKIRKSGRYEYKGQMNQFGLEDGIGVKTLQDSTILKGYFMQGLFVSGQINYPDHSIYIGKVNEEGQKHDTKCSFTLTDGRCYQGSIFNDGESGEGFIGTKFIQWINGQMIE